jgi:membrane-bound lytic murein transglycosylase B
VILAYIADFGREFGDRAPLKASTTRSYNLYRRSGMTREQFIAKLFEARSVTRDRSRSTGYGEAGASGPVRTRMAFYFAVL